MQVQINIISSSADARLKAAEIRALIAEQDATAIVDDRVKAVKAQALKTKQDATATIQAERELYLLTILPSSGDSTNIKPPRK